MSNHLILIGVPKGIRTPVAGVKDARRNPWHHPSPFICGISNLCDWFPRAKIHIVFVSAFVSAQYGAHRTLVIMLGVFLGTITIAAGALPFQKQPKQIILIGAADA